MWSYILERFVQSLLAILIVLVVVFGLARLTGDPLALFIDPTTASVPEAREEAARFLNLDKPLSVQFGIFLAHAAKGDFGKSIRGSRPVLPLVLGRFPATLKLGAVAILFGVLVAIPLGVLSATRRDSLLDRGGRFLAVLGQSLPSFWVGIMLIWFFAVIFKLLPAGGYGGGSIKHLILPSITLGMFLVAGLMRLLRSAMLDVLGSEYVKMARIKGLPERVVIWKHALKNAAIPVVTYAGVLFIGVLSGSVVTETVFAWPGVGRLAYESIFHRDFPVIQAVVFLLAMGYILMNFAVDILYVWLDPRIRLRE